MGPFTNVWTNLPFKGLNRLFLSADSAILWTICNIWSQLGFTKNPNACNQGPFHVILSPLLRFFKI
jgi:hypothetical protein